MTRPAHVIDTPERFKAFAHPLRQDLLARLDQPRSVTALASELGVSPARLYHHVKVLEEVGLIEVAGTRRVRSNDERLYARVAGTVRFRAGVTARPAVRREIGESAADAGRELAAGFVDAVRAWERGELDPESPIAIGSHTLHLTDDEAREVHRLIADAVAQVVATRRRRSKARREWTYASLFFPEQPSGARRG